MDSNISNRISRYMRSVGLDFSDNIPDRMKTISIDAAESTLTLFQRFGDFKKILLTSDKYELLAALESENTNTDYGLILSRVKASLEALTFLYTCKSFDIPSRESAENERTNGEVTLQIKLYPKQSIIETLETLLVPNLTIVDRFEFRVPQHNYRLYLGLWLISDAMQVSNLRSTRFVVEPIQSTPEYANVIDNIPNSGVIIFPNSLVLVFEDADLSSSIYRFLDMLNGLAVGHRKVCVWIQQSVREKFFELFTPKMDQLSPIDKSKIHLEVLKPDLIPSWDALETYIEFLTFRYVTDLISEIDKYPTLRDISLWTSNVSCAYEVISMITNCHQFAINTISDSPSFGSHPILHSSNVDYEIVSKCSFQSRLPISSFIRSVRSSELPKKIFKENKIFSVLSIEERFNKIVFMLSRNENITFQAIDLVRKAKLNHSSFKTVNKYLISHELLPVGLISINFDAMDLITDQSLILGLIGSILLYGNYCLLVVNQAPEMIKQFVHLFNLHFPGSIYTSSASPNKTIPYGWLIADDCKTVGLSLGLRHLTSLFGFDDCLPLFGRIRSTSIPVADQLRF